VKLERKERRFNPEARRGMRCEDDRPRINIFGGVSLVERAGLSAGEMRILKMGAVISAVILGAAGFLLCRL
jgi:hypothetical protein